MVEVVTLYGAVSFVADKEDSGAAPHVDQAQANAFVGLTTGDMSGSRSLFVNKAGPGSAVA